METPPFFYRVNICFQKSKNHLTGIEEVEEVIREYKDKNPIKARIAAFSFFISYIETLLEARNSKYKDIEDAYDKLKDIFRPATRSFFKNGALESGLPDVTGKKCQIELVVNDPIEVDEVGEAYLVFELNNYEVIYTDLIDLLVCLQMELNYYNHFNLDKDKLETSEMVYCIEDDDIQSYSFLKVPLKWEGKEINPDNLIEINDLPVDEGLLKKIIREGESDWVEFKPSLVYNFNTNGASIGVKENIAKTLCAFANSKKTCILFIGVKDDGFIQGLEVSDFKILTEKNPKDFFQLEFSEMLNQFFGNSLANRIKKTFIEIDGKIIFIVKVLPSDNPMFMRKYINRVPEDKFYYREGPSSKEIRDIKEIVKFCLERFRKN